MVVCACPRRTCRSRHGPADGIGAPGAAARRDGAFDRGGAERWITPWFQVRPSSGAGCLPPFACGGGELLDSRAGLDGRVDGEQPDPIAVTGAEQEHRRLDAGDPADAEIHRGDNLPPNQ